MAKASIIQPVTLEDELRLVLTTIRNRATDTRKDDHRLVAETLIEIELLATYTLAKLPVHHV